MLLAHFICPISPSLNQVVGGPVRYPTLVLRQLRPRPLRHSEPGIALPKERKRLRLPLELVVDHQRGEEFSVLGYFGRIEVDRALGKIRSSATRRVRARLRARLRQGRRG